MKETERSHHVELLPKKQIFPLIIEIYTYVYPYIHTYIYVFQAYLRFRNFEKQLKHIWPNFIHVHEVREFTSGNQW